MTIKSFSGDFRFLSNFWPCQVQMGELRFPSTENAYQAAKTLDLEKRKEFQNITSAQAKKLGSRLVIRPDWDQVKLGVMEGLLRQKFAQGTDLRKQLDATKPQELIEGNWWHDNFWGSCECTKKAECQTPGKNHLGNLLMKIRNGE